MFLGMVDDYIKNNKWSFGQIGGTAGPETCKNCQFLMILKKTKNLKKNISKLDGITKIDPYQGKSTQSLRNELIVSAGYPCA